MNAKILRVSDIFQLQLKGRFNAPQIIVPSEGIFEWTAIGPSDGDKIYNATGGGFWERILDSRTKLAVPVTFTVTTVSTSELDVAWSAVANATTYLVERASNNTFTSGLAIAYTGNLLTFRDSGLTLGTTYYYRITSSATGYSNSTFIYANGATSSTALPILANRIAEFRFAEGGGQKTFNAVGGNAANYNLIHPSEQQWIGEANLVNSIYNSSEMTPTNNYRANARGNVQMRRIVTLAGAVENPGTGAYAGGRIQEKTFPAGTYKLSLEVISNTGVAQNIRMLVNGGVISGDLVVGTTHSRVSATIIHPGGSPLLYYCINGSAGTPLDISIDKIYFGDPAFDYVEPEFDLMLGELGTSAADDPTWRPGSKGLAMSSEAKFAYGMKATPVNFVNIAVHVVAKVNAASITQNVLFGTKYGDGGFELSAGAGGTADSGIMPHFKFRNQEAKAKLSKYADGLWHHYAGTYNQATSTLNFYVDRLLVASFNTSLTAVDISRLLLNHTPVVGGVGGNIEFYYVGLFNANHTQSDVNQQGSWISGQAAADGVILADLQNVIAAEGDSITIDANTYAKKGIRAMSTSVIAENFATVGAQISTLEARWPTVKNWLLQFPAKNRILSLFIGANDLTNAGMDVAAWVARVKAYCLQAKSDVAGLKIVFCTPLPNTTSAQKANRAVAIPLQVADNSYRDRLVRFDLVPGMGADGDENNTTYYLPDKVHLNDNGNATISPYWKTEIEAVMI